ncbi:diguanylate cyclase [Halothiobacillus sp. DCM-1]|uniref:GGDEF domain-containing protein n=1 Tax=Halothiobacillus sp. DCM-1 TaxID=3112558 RepID=UPI00324B0C6D
MDFLRLDFSRHIFRALAWGMVTLGLAMGALFPLFILVFGVPQDIAFSRSFIISTLIAGFVVGNLNFLLASRIVRPRLTRLAERMQHVRNAMQRATFSGDWSACDPADCRLEERDEDEIGAVAKSYNALLYALHDAHRIEDRIRNFTATLSSKLDLSELGDQALRLLMDLSNAQGGALILERQGEWHLLASHGLTSPAQILESPAFHTLRESPKQTRMSLPPEVSVDAILAQFKPSDVLLTPILNHGLTLGWCVLASATPFAEETPRIMPLLMNGLGLALNNALLHDDLQRVAALDPLTGIYNRRFGFKRLEEELSRAERNQSPLAAMIFDLDHFKRVNDTFGHLAGDRVLIRAAQLARDLLREGDVILRYGGEEFVIVLPGAGLQDARNVAERVRFAISQAEFPIGGDQSLKVTASIGVCATNGKQPISAEALINAADQRLYAAKASGRNRVIADESLQENTPSAH